MFEDGTLGLGAHGLNPCCLGAPEAPLDVDGSKE